MMKQRMWFINFSTWRYITPDATSCDTPFSHTNKTRIIGRNLRAKLLVYFVFSFNEYIYTVRHRLSITQTLFQRQLLCTNFF